MRPSTGGRLWPRFAASGALVLVLTGSASLMAQGRGTPPPAAVPQTAKDAAPIDLTGVWVSVITEDWRWRMVTPAKGDYASVPITAEAMKVADGWDAAKDTVAGEQCRSYGAAGLMRLPGRARISWADDNTLKVEFDAGTQTRLLKFGVQKSAAAAAPTWQGQSVAEWEGPRRPARRGAPAGGEGRAGVVPAAPPPPTFGNLKVVTTKMRPGYLRKNGIPYSADAVMTEYWDLNTEPNGTQWLVITTLIDDPKYLQRQFVTTPNFKKEPDASKWEPTQCSAFW